MMSRSQFAAPALILTWLAAQLWVYLPTYSSVTDAAFITNLMVEEIAVLSVWISAWSWVTWQVQGRTRLALHTSIAAGASFIDAAFLNYGIPWMFFNYGWPWPNDMHNTPKTALITLTVLIHLHMASRKGLNRRLLALWLSGSVLAMVLVSADTWAKKNDQAAAEKLPYSPNIYAPAFVVKPEHKLQEGLEHMWSIAWGDQ